ncbi:MAG: 50S ribosomal protein L24 [Candidatus Nanohaloarchaea archaeon]|nr:50S ribosomal protein L24 [Candidatus Nanohaloarchaea archaeon]
MSDWNKNWQSSEKPGKQRKHRENAPYHQRKKFLSARLADDVRDRVGTKTLPLREGDKAEIMRGEWSDATGRVEDVDYEDKKVYISGVETERVDTSDAKIPIDPSNLKITKLDLDDEERLAKYEVSEEDRQEIEAADEEDEAEASDEDAEDDDEAEDPDDAGDETGEEADEDDGKGDS